MNTEFLQKLIPETVEGRDEIIQKIFAQHGKDINAEKAKFADYDDLKDKVKKADETISELKLSADDAIKLRTKIDEYEQKEAQRAELEAKNAKQRELTQRFATVKGEVEFIDPDVETFILGKFGAALEDEAFKGKGDAEIYTALTQDKPFFKNQSAPPPNMGGIGAGAKTTITPEQFKAMGIPERTELAQKDPKQYELLTKRS